MAEEKSTCHFRINLRSGRCCLFGVEALQASRVCLFGRRLHLGGYTLAMCISPSLWYISTL